jgi:hypothetical protein
MKNQNAAPTCRSLRLPFVLLALVAMVLLSSCLPEANPSAGGAREAGFFIGLWHGIILPLSFAVSLFTDDINIYEVANNGNWYDFGFVLGAMISLGGGGAGAGSRRG